MREKAGIAILRSMAIFGGSTVAFIFGVEAALQTQNAPTTATAGILIASAGLVTALGGVLTPIYRLYLAQKQEELRFRTEQQNLYGMIQQANQKHEILIGEVDRNTQSMKQMKEEIHCEIAQVPSLITITAEDSLICDAAMAVGPMFGWTREELIGRPVDIIIPPIERDRHDQAMREILSGARKVDPKKALHINPMRHDGSTFKGRAYVSQWKTPKGSIMLTATIWECVNCHENGQKD